MPTSQNLDLLKKMNVTQLKSLWGYLFNVRECKNTAKKAELIKRIETFYNQNKVDLEFFIPALVNPISDPVDYSEKDVKGISDNWLTMIDIEREKVIAILQPRSHWNTENKIEVIILDTTCKFQSILEIDPSQWLPIPTVQEILPLLKTYLLSPRSKRYQTVQLLIHSQSNLKSHWFINWGVEYKLQSTFNYILAETFTNSEPLERIAERLIKQAQHIRKMYVNYILETQAKLRNI